jgi:two-component system, sensor histidine kinase and response regulator
VLMDVQMPEMDGLAATIALRERENGTKYHQPVVAMTALVMKGDRERCLDAGMDGYLSKPIRQRELDEILDRYAGQAGTAVASVELPRPSNKTIDTGELLERIGDDRVFLLELLDIFRDTAPPLMQAVHESFERNDQSAMEHASHALKGSLINLGATNASGMAATLEAFGKSGNISGAPSVMRQLDDELVLVVSVLDSLCQGALVENSHR